MALKIIEDSNSAQMFGRSSLNLAIQRATGSKPYLGDVAVVGDLVRSFLAATVERIVAVGEGTEDRRAAALADMAGCGRMAAMFLGHNTEYESVGQWNSGGGMVDWMYKQLDHYYEQPETNREALVQDVFAQATLFVYEAVSAREEEETPDDLQDDLSNLADDLTYFLLGIPGKFANRLSL